MLSELALFDSPATRYICQMRLAPAANRTRHVGSVTCAWYRLAVSLTSSAAMLRMQMIFIDTIFVKVILCPHCKIVVIINAFFLFLGG